MGTFAKIFIVVNLVLAVVFLGAAATLLGTGESWKVKHQTVKQQFEEDIASLDQKIKSINAENAKLRTDKTAAVSRVGELEKLIESKDRDSTQIVERLNEVINDYKVQSKAMSDMRQDVEAARQQNLKLQGEVTAANDRAAKAKEDYDNIATDLAREKATNKRANDDLAQAEREKTELAEKLDKQTNILAMLTAKLGADVVAGIPDMPAISGTVTGIDEELNIVLISVGADDDVKVGFTFTVYRGGDYLGRMIVDKVGADWASGHMAKDETKEFPKQGDDVATQM